MSKNHRSKQGWDERQETLDRWAEYERTGEAVSNEEMEAWLDSWGSEDEKLPALIKDVAEGIRSLDRGEGKPLDIEAIKAKGRERLKRRQGK